MCYGEGRGLGGDVFAAVWRCGVSWLWVVAFDFRKLCTDVTHLQPLSGTGRFWRCFLVGNEWFEW